jgi:precorrin-3B synthase
MNAPAQLRRGWCPSVSRPIRSGDGLLIRLNIGEPGLAPELALALSDCAKRFGNGLIDLTQRANLQLRGISDATLPQTRERLSALGLGTPHDLPPVAGNILAPPLVGLDREARLDIGPVLLSLRQRLAMHPSLWALPPKFCILLDDGGRLGLSNVEADIRFEALAAREGLRLRVALGGHRGDATPVGTVDPHEVPDVAVALARAFASLCAGDERVRRMRDLLQHVGTAKITEALAVACLQWEGGAVEYEAAPVSASRGHSPPIGFHPLGGDMGYLVVGAPFGRLTCEQLALLARLSLETGAHLRLTPWRSVLLAGLGRLQALSIEDQLASADLIIDSGDPRLAVTACPGAPACERATVPTRQDALALAALARGLAPDGVVLHLSGCAKGCARRESSRITLVGRDGRYDLIVDGPAHGKPLRESLTLADVTSALSDRSASVVRRHAREPRPPGALG